MILVVLPLVAQMVKRLPAMRKTQVRSLGWEDSLEIPALAAGHQTDVLILQACIAKCDFLLLSFP